MEKKITIEYRVEMFRYGKWEPLALPTDYGYAGYIMTDKRDAVVMMNRAKMRWDARAENLPEKYMAEIPTEYRILSRIVSKWMVESKEA